MKLNKRKILSGAAILLLLLLLLAFPFGPLFPWSPVKLGYSSASYARASVYYDAHTPLPAAYGQLDQMLSEAEAFHQLQFQRPVRVVACKDWTACKSYLPWLPVNALGGVTLANGEVIYITPKLKEKNFNTAEFLRHELSHALISQHTTIRKSLKLTEQAWFSEGLAVSFGQQQAYLSRAEFVEKAAQTELARVIDPQLMKQSAPDWSARFAYPAQRYFLEFLKHTYGGERFQQFLLKYIQAPDDYRQLFAEVFPLSFADAIALYQQTVRAGQWPPAE